MYVLVKLAFAFATEGNSERLLFDVLTDPSTGTPSAAQLGFGCDCNTQAALTMLFDIEWAANGNRAVMQRIFGECFDIAIDMFWSCWQCLFSQPKQELVTKNVEKQAMLLADLTRTHLVGLTLEQLRHFSPKGAR